MKTIVCLECSKCGSHARFAMPITDITHPKHGEANLRNAAMLKRFAYYNDKTQEVCFDCITHWRGTVPHVVAELDNVRVAYVYYQPDYGIYHLEVFRDERWNHVSGSAMRDLPDYYNYYSKRGIVLIYRQTLTKRTRQQQTDPELLEREAFSAMHYDLIRRMKERDGHSR